ncbi:MAG: aminopeptidase P family protein [Solirubrobacterales bacterium]
MNHAPDARADRAAEAVAAAGLDVAIVGDLVRPGDSNRESIADVTWLTGYGGTSGTVVIGPGVRVFITDFRYTELAAEVVPESFRIVDATADILKEVASHLTGKAGFEPAKTSVETHRKLLEAIGEVAELVATEDLLTDLRRVKDEAEIEAIAAAAALTDEVYAWIEEQGLSGRTEREVALAAEQQMRELGAEGPSFPAIVASGPNGALPHAVPGDRVIERGEYVTIDMGAIVDGYCSDCTRTLVEGDPDPAQKQVYDLVLASQLAALEAVRAGANGRAVDAISREPIAEAGYGERYGHGLGHGVGIDVHEPPRLSKRSDDTLLAGDVVTVEPGIYIPGEFGVRIEDLVVVTEDGYRNLSSRPK